MCTRATLNRKAERWYYRARKKVVVAATTTTHWRYRPKPENQLQNTYNWTCNASSDITRDAICFVFSGQCLYINTNTYFIRLADLGPMGFEKNEMTKAFRESISDKYLLERVCRVHQSTCILTVFLINCFCIYAEVDQLPMSKYFTPVVILTQPMRALVSPSVDFCDLIDNWPQSTIVHRPSKHN